MIFDNIANIGVYRCLSDNFAKAIDFISGRDVLALTVGNYGIDDRRVYAFVSETAMEKDNQVWEGHRVYADIQMVLSGAERIGVASYHQPGDDAIYNPEKDVYFCQVAGETNNFQLYQGDFVVFLPGEKHRPNCSIPGYPVSRKLVVKVRVG